MADTQSQEDFEHLHRDGIKNLDAEHGRLAEARSRTNLYQLDDDLQATLKNVRDKLSGTLGRGAEHVFKQAMRSLKETDAKRFIIENALESLKAGKTIKDTLTKYSELGLITAEGPAPSGNELPLSTTLALVERKSIWERVTTAVIQVGVNALKTIPKWVEIEPHVGFIGPVPHISFALKAKGMTVHDFLEALGGAES